MAKMADGSLVIADYGNLRIRRLHDALRLTCLGRDRNHARYWLLEEPDEDDDADDEEEDDDDVSPTTKKRPRGAKASADKQAATKRVIVEHGGDAVREDRRGSIAAATPSGHLGKPTL